MTSPRPTSISHTRYCGTCQAITPWWTKLLTYNTFIDVYCACLTCGGVAKAVVAWPWGNGKGEPK